MLPYESLLCVISLGIYFSLETNACAEGLALVNYWGGKDWNIEEENKIPEISKSLLWMTFGVVIHFPSFLCK